MADRDLRQLERAAAGGDPGAAVRLAVERARAGEPVELVAARSPDPRGRLWHHWTPFDPNGISRPICGGPRMMWANTRLMLDDHRHARRQQTVLGRRVALCRRCFRTAQDPSVRRLTLAELEAARRG